MRVLLINDRLPYPVHGGAELRVHSLLQRIARQHEVWLVTFLDQPEETEGVVRMKEFCYRVETVELQHRHPLAYAPGMLQYGLTAKPLELRFYHSDELADKIRHLVSIADFDLVEIANPHMALYLEVLPPGLRSKCLLTFTDVEFERFNRIFQIERRPSKKLRAWLHSRMMRRWEPYYAQLFRGCITTSEADRRLLLAANPRLHVSVVPNGVDTQAYQPLPVRDPKDGLIFVGSMDYSPCIDAMLYFCHEVLPRIRSVVSEVNLWIVGKNPGSGIMRLNGNGVHVTGRVNDLAPYYGRSAVSVVPLRAGGGTRLKILEAMALGRPVVSTSIGCEGLDVADGEHLLVADTPEQFSEQVVRLLTDRGLYERLSINARQLVVDHYDWDVITGQLLDLYREAAL